MNIALLMKSFNREEKDAAVTTVLNLAKELRRVGHNAVIITDRGFRYYERCERNPKFETIDAVPVYRPYYLSWFSTKKWFLDPTVIFNRILAQPLGVRHVQKKLKIKFDVIHSFGAAPPFVLMSWLSRIFNRKARIIHSVKSYSAHTMYRFSPGSHFFSKLLNLADTIIVPSKIMAENTARHGCKRSKIKIIHSSYDSKKFYPKNKDELREKYKTTGKRIILYYGQTGPQKGVEYLIKAAPYIVRAIPNAEIWLAHPSYPSKEMEALIRQNEKKSHLKLIKGKVKIEDFVNIAEAVILPYSTMKATEANPLCLLESVACKTPVVTIDFPELRELFVPEKEILMAEPRNPESLARTIIMLLKNKSLQKSLAENAYKKIKNFTIEKITEQHIKLYKSLLKNNF